MDSKYAMIPALMSYSEWEKGRREDGRAVVFTILYIVACYLIVPHGWTTCAAAAFPLIFFASPPDLLNRVLCFTFLAAIVFITHKHQTSSDFNLWTHNQDAKLYAFELFIALVSGFVVMAIPELTKLNNAWGWFLGFWLIYFLLLPLRGPHHMEYRAAYLFCFPFAICAYKCRGLYRIIALVVFALTMGEASHIMNTHNNFLIGCMFSYGWIVTIIAAWFIHLLYTTFAEVSSA